MRRKCRSGRKEDEKMANKRMFSLDVIDTDNFMEMPLTAQALYFHLGMRADDDGFISSPRQIMKAVECKQDDMKILVSKGFVIPFENGVVVIRHWKQNNYIRPDRYRETSYLAEKKQLVIENNIYNMTQTGMPSDIPVVTELDTQYRLGKYSIDKDSIGIICSEPDKPAPNPSGILLPLVDKSLYDVPLDKISIWQQAYPAVDIKQELQKMKSWLESNPSRKKTKRGINRFINNWLSREQDEGGIYKNHDKNSGCGQKESTEAALARHRISVKPPECPDGPFQ